MGKNVVMPREGAVRFRDVLGDKNLPFKKKAEYFWEYYKWHAIGTIIAVITLIIIFAPMIGRVPRDAYILYAGPVRLDRYQTAELEEAFQSILVVEDGEPNIHFHPMAVVTPEQADRLRREAVVAGVTPPLFADPHGGMEAFVDEMRIGYTVIVLLSPELFATHANNQRLLPLSEVLSVVPTYATCDYGILFASTAFARYFSATNPIPNDTVLAIIRRPIHMRAAHHERSMNFFRQIVEFESN
ncbi:MAG: hypothetical protein FWB93_01805 [Oscillospiraceae bacterium]|nr:hypothetical protein [Oscillospiraceae bacterium]